MVSVSILPGEFLWTREGVHDVDENDFARVASEHVVVEMASREVAERAYRVIARQRKAMRHLYYCDGVASAYVMGGCKTGKWSLLRDGGGGVLVPQDDFVICNDTVGVLYDDVDMSKIPTRVKKVVKKQWVTRELPRVVERDEMRVDIEYDKGLGRHVARLRRTGRRVMAEDEEELEVYDESGRVVGKHKHVWTEEREVEEPVLDAAGEPVLEPVLDAAGEPVLEPTYPCKIVGSAAGIAYEVRVLKLLGCGACSSADVVGS